MYKTTQLSGAQIIDRISFFEIFFVCKIILNIEACVNLFLFKLNNIKEKSIHGTDCAIDYTFPSVVQTTIEH